MANEIDVSNTTYSNPTVVSGGVNSSETPVFFTVTNARGLSAMSSAGHFGKTDIDGHVETFDRIVASLGGGDTVGEDSGKKSRLFIVESRKVDGKTIPARVFSAEIVSETGNETPSLRITESLNLVDGLPKQDVDLGFTTKLEANGKLSEKEANKLRAALDEQSSKIASAQKSDLSDSMAKALAQAADASHEPATPDGYKIAMATPAKAPQQGVASIKSSSGIAA